MILNVIFTYTNSKSVMMSLMNNSSTADIEYQFGDLDVHTSLSMTVRILLAVFLITASIVGTLGNIVVLALFIK